MKRIALAGSRSVTVAARLEFTTHVALIVGSVLLNFVFVNPSAADQLCEEFTEDEWLSEDVSYWPLLDKDLIEKEYWDDDVIGLRREIIGSPEWRSYLNRTQTDLMLHPVNDLRLIYPVTRDLTASITMLASQSFIPLNQSQVLRFSEATSAEVIERANLGRKPYLVRAVFPSPNPSEIGVRWRGSTLFLMAYVFSECEAYAKHPVIVFLKRQPETVEVTAGSGG